jgi:hypothetical protein
MDGDRPSSQTQTYERPEDKKEQEKERLLEKLRKREKIKILKK